MIRTKCPQDPSGRGLKSKFLSSSGSSVRSITVTTSAQQAPHIVQLNVFFSGFVMPLYVFKCDNCSKRIERLMPFDGPIPSCEDCSVEMKKQIAPTNFSLKGPGWAKDNYGLKGD